MRENSEQLERGREIGADWGGEIGRSQIIQNLIGHGVTGLDFIHV